MIIRLTRENIISGGHKIAEDLDDEKKFIILNATDEKTEIHVYGLEAAYNLSRSLEGFLNQFTNPYVK